MSNIIVVSQNAATKVITGVVVEDNGVTGDFLSFSSQLSTTNAALSNKLFSGLGEGKVLVIRVSNGNIVVLLVNDPNLQGSLIVEETSVSEVVEALADALYRGI